MTSTSALPRPHSCSESELAKVDVDVIETHVAIRRSPWDSGSSVDILVDHLWNFQMRDRAGGVGKRNPGGRQFLYAIMSCEDLPEDSYFPHSCRHGRAPHHILVCICRCDNPTIYENLRKRISNS